jgi:non-ribosomal peptide synthetase component F
MGLQAIVNVLLSAYTGQDDLIVGCPVAGREQPELADQVGFYLNVVPLRTRIPAQAPFEHYFKQLAAQTREAFDHQAFPFDQLVGELDIRRDLSPRRCST